MAAGLPNSSFWIVWPIASLIIVVAALVAAVLQKLLGAAGTLLTVIVIMLFGNPSSGGVWVAGLLVNLWLHVEIGRQIGTAGHHVLTFAALFVIAAKPPGSSRSELPEPPGKTGPIR